MFGGGIMNVFRGIGQAAKLADRGIRPFGQKQTYKQNVITKGVGEQQFNEIYDQFLNKVPDRVIDEPSGKALHTGLMEAEAVMTGQKLGLLNQEQRAKIAYAMTDKIKRQIYDDPVPGLNNDYLEYMDDAIDRMESVFEIYELGGDITPKPGKRTPPYGTKEMSNVIPFKPRDKKSMGGQIGVGSLFRSR